MGRRRFDAAREDVEGEGLERVRAKRRGAVERAVEGDAEAELIRARIGRAIGELLRCHEERRAEALAGLGEAQIGVCAGGRG